MATIDLERRVVTGCEAGWYGLPEDILSAWHARSRLDALTAEIRTAQMAVSVATVVGEAAAKLAAAATGNGRISADPGPILATEAKSHRLGASLRVAEEALAIAGRELHEAFVDNFDTIVTDFLDPAIQATLTEAHELSGHYAAGIPSADSVRFLPEAERELYDRLDGAARRYWGIRTAQRHVEQLSGSPTLGDLFSVYSDPTDDAIWGVIGFANRHQRTWRPEPEEPHARLLWMADPTRSHLVRVLTGAEQDRRTLEAIDKGRSRQPGEALGATVIG